jgi:fucose permease
MVRVVSARNAVALSFFLNGSCFATWVARLPEIRHRLDLTNGEIGLVLLAASCGSILSLTAAGGIIARHGAATTVRFAVVVNTIGLLGVSLGAVVVEQAAAVAVALFVWGLGMGMWDVAMNVEGAEVEHRLARNIMPRFHALFSLGTVAGAGVGAVTTRFDVPMLVVLPAVAFLVLVTAQATTGAFLPPEASDVDQPEPGTVLSAWRERRTLLIGLLVLTLALTEGAANDWLAIALVDGHDVAAWMGVAGYAVFVSAMTAGRFFGTGLLDRFGRAATLWGTMAMAVVGVLLVVYGGNPVLIVGGIVLWGVGASLGFPVGMSAAADDPVHAPARVSVVSTIAYTAFVGGPPMLGFVGDHVGALDALLLISLLLIPSALLVPAARTPAGLRGTVSGR